MTEDRRRVCVVSTSRSFGGAEAYLGRIAAGLAGTYDFVALVPSDADPETVALLRDAGAAVKPLQGLRRLPSARGAWAVAQALAYEHPSLLHLNLTDQRDGSSALLAAKYRRLPVVSTLNLVLPSRSRAKELSGQLVLRGSNAVIAVSRAVGEYLRSLGVEPRVVRQGLEKPVLADDARDSLGLGRDDFVVGGVGRLHEQKGWDVLCEAAEQVHRTRPDVRFVVVGEGPAETRLRASKACGDVEFVGHRANASALMGAFDLLAVPSRYEAFGLVALEAMLSGVPVVATRSGGLVEVVDGAGRLVPSESPDELAGAILDLASDEASRAASVSRGLERATSEFGLQRMLDETQAIYEELCAC